jgi:hypothetical protein
MEYTWLLCIYVGHFKSSARCACAASRMNDFHDSCEPGFSKEHCVLIGRLCGPCFAKQEETDWSQISRSDQRSYIKIETLRRKNPNKVHNALREVCWDSVVDRSTVSRWTSRFREGQVSIQEDPRRGRPVTATDDTSVVIVSTVGRWSMQTIWRNCAWSKHVNRLFSESWLKL